MAELDFIDIAIAPPDVLETSLVEKVATIVNKDLYETRLQLAGKIPRIIFRCQTGEAAKAIVQSLTALGIVAFTYRDSELRKHSTGRFRAHSLKRGEGKIRFRDNGSVEKSLPAENVFLILQGTMQTYIEKESTETKMKFSLTRTMLTGGFPVWHPVQEKTKGVTVQTEGFIRLYERASMEPSVEIFQHDLDYSFLGQQLTSSSLQNLNATAAELRKAFPQAAFDDRLANFGASISFACPVDSIELNCRLIYLYHQAVSSPG